MPTTFEDHKARILHRLDFDDRPEDEELNAQILPLITKLNAHPQIVTISSKAGRVNVFLEGEKQAGQQPETQHRNGTGQCLFVSHEPIERAPAVSLIEMILCGKRKDGTYAEDERPELLNAELMDDYSREIVFDEETRLVHFKFEAMLLRLQTETLELANTIMNCAVSAGFRESGIIHTGSLTNPYKSIYPTVAIRTTELSLDTIIAILLSECDQSRASFYNLYEENQKLLRLTVPENMLPLLVDLSNQKFVEHKKRIDRFTKAVEDVVLAPKPQTINWEDAERPKNRNYSRRRID